MKKEDILKASEEELQKRKNELWGDPHTWNDEPNEQHKEFLMIAETLALLRGEKWLAIHYSQQLSVLYGETISRKEK